jgi:hypothetical protein
MSDKNSGVQSQKALDTQTDAPKSAAETLEEKAVGDYSRVEDNGELSMHVKVYSPFKDYYDGQAFSISAENATGPFDILPKHHNFLSLLLPCELAVRTVGKGDRRIRISGGLMHVKADEIIVFLDV